MNRFATLLLLLLSACGSPQLLQVPDTAFRLLPPREVEAPALLKQRVTLLTAERSQQFLLAGRFERQNLQLVVLLPSGQRLLSLDYDGEELKQSGLTSLELPGQDILAIMQFAFWPEASLRTHYPQREGWRVQVSSEERKLLTHSGIVLSVAFHPGELRIDNYLKEYRVIAQTLEKSPL